MYNTSFVHCMDPEWESSSNSLHCTATCSFQRQCKRGRRSCNSGSRDFITTNSTSAWTHIHAGTYDDGSCNSGSRDFITTNSTSALTHIHAGTYDDGSCNSGSRDFIMTNSMSALIDIHAGMYDQRSAVCEKSGAMAIPTLQPSPCSGKAHFGKVAV